MKIVTLMENTACRSDIAAAHGLSLYIETAAHKILFDMGPDGAFAENAEKLDVDLAAVDIAILSHGHYDHGGGLDCFCRSNPHARIYLHRAAFGEYYARNAEGGEDYVGLDRNLDRERFILAGSELEIDEELSLFAEVTDRTGALASSANLFAAGPEGLTHDRFAHEQNLLIRSEGKTVLLAGCAHCGIVNILQEAERRLGCRPDVTFGGFHMFRLEAGDPAGDALIDSTGTALLGGSTVYYTGHCTGEYAYGRLKTILGDRLQPMTGGGVVEL